MIFWRCYYRFISLLIIDIICSLILLWTLFYEQYSDKILLKIKHDLHSQVEKISTNEQFIFIASYQSPVFVMQILFASLPFIASLLSYKHTSISSRDTINLPNDC
jgi:hypothetical protein